MKRTVLHTSQSYLSSPLTQPPNLFPFLNSKSLDLYSKQLIKYQSIYTQCNASNIGKVIPLPQPSKQFVFFGRSNVGKSTLMNALMQAHVAPVSKRPGKTKELLFCELGGGGAAGKGKGIGVIGGRLFFVDVPGYGFATGVSKSEIKSWGKLITSYLKLTKPNSQNQRILCLLDITHNLKQTDCIVFQLLKSLQKPFMIIFTKCDKFSLNEESDEMKNALEILSNIQAKYQKQANFYAHFTSCRIGVGIDQLRNHIMFQAVSDQL